MNETISLLFAAAEIISVTEIIYAVFVVLLGYVVLGISGFGSALIIVPLLAWKWPLVSVVPLVLLMDTPASVLHARLNNTQIAWAEIKPLVPGLLVGAALGALTSQWTSQPWALYALGLYVVGVAAKGLLSLGTPSQMNKRWAPLAGILAGAVETAFGTAGPLIVSWLSGRLTDPQALRATTPVLIVAASSCALLGMSLSGQLNQAIIWIALPALLLVAFGGVEVGHRIALRLPAQRLRQAIFAFMAISGAALLARAAA